MEAIELLRRLLHDLEQGNNTQSARIRKGAQGSVAKVKDNDGREIALKVIDYGGRADIDVAKAIQNLEREYSSLRLLSHPSIIRFLGFEHKPMRQQAYIKMEWATSVLAESGEAIDLGDLICHHDGRENGGIKSYLPESFIWHVLFHISAALSLCHHGIELHRKVFLERADSSYILSRLIDPPQRLHELARNHPRVAWQTERITFSLHATHEPIVHRDIKPSNILLSDPPLSTYDDQWRTERKVTLNDEKVFSLYPTILLGDFGISVPLRDAHTQGIGTFGYAAPEVPTHAWRPHEEQFVWSTACDIFSLGATIAHLMSMERPVVCQGNSDFLPGFPDQYSQELRNLVTRCCSIEPSERPTSIEILDVCISRSPWARTYVTPYGSLVSSNFSNQVNASWQECMKVVCPNLESLVKESKPEQLIPRALDILALSSREGESAIPMLIAGAYQIRHFGTDAKRLLPWPRQSGFIGRQDILQQLHVLINGESDKATVVLNGLGGIGKTQIAIEFVYRECGMDPGRSVFWVSGMSVSSFEESYRQIASACGVYTDGDVDSMLMRRVKNWLEGPFAGRWLMIVDNVDDVPFFRDNQLPFIPNNLYGFLLFTSRDGSLAKCLDDPVLIPVSGMSDQESLEFVLSATPDTDTAKAATLVKSLNNHPLAISQALAFSKNLGITLDEYLGLLLDKEEQKERLLRYEFVSPGRERGMESLGSTFVVSLHELQKRTPLSMDILGLMSFFDASSIPVSLIAKEYKEKLAFSEALSALWKFSLVNVNLDGSAYSVHSLVQLVTKYWVSSQGSAQQFHQRALKLLCQYFPDYQQANWKGSFELLPHVDQVLIPERNSSSLELDVARAELIIKATPFYTKKGKLGTAERMAREADHLMCQATGEQSVDRSRAAINVAGVLLAEGQYKEASKYAEMGVTFLKKRLGPEAVQSIDALGMLGLVIQSNGEYSRALAIHQEELMLRRCREMDAESPAILNSMMNIALVLDRLGNYEEAEKMYRQALLGREKLLGSEHPETLMCQSDLAVSLQHQGRPFEALEFQEKSLTGLEATLGQESPLSLKALARLASMKKDIEDLTGSELAYTKALESMKAILGEDHPETLECVAELGNVFFLQGNVDLAGKRIQASVQTSERVLGAEHPQTLAITKREAMFLQGQGRLREAEMVYRKVWASRRRVLGPRHPDTVDSASDLISVLSDQGRAQEGADLAILLSENSSSQNLSLGDGNQHSSGPSRSEEFNTPTWMSIESAFGQLPFEVRPTLDISSHNYFLGSSTQAPDVNEVNKWIIDRKRKGRRNENLVDDFMSEMIARRDHLFIIDDNISMQRYWEEVKRVFKALSYIINMGDNDGVEVIIGATNLKSWKSDLEFEPLWTSGNDLVEHLKKVLFVYTSRIQGARDHKPANIRFRSRDFHGVKPLSVYILTNGISLYFQEIPELIGRFYHGLPDHESKPLALQFIVFGSDQVTWRKFEQLDNSFGDKDYDVVDTTASTGNVRKMLLGPIVNSFDLDNNDPGGQPEEYSVRQHKDEQSMSYSLENNAISSSSTAVNAIVKKEVKSTSSFSLSMKARMFSRRLRERVKRLF